MNTEFQLKMQAYLDGELSAREAQDVEAQMKAMSEAPALLAELQFTRSALRGNEPEYVLPETREFYWNKIERDIMAQEKAAGSPGNSFRFGWLFRYWPQLSGATMAAALLMFAAMQFHWFSSSRWDDIENPLEETGSFTFRSEQQRMTLVWVSTPVASEEDDESESVN